jgi:hypothetical protein
MSSQTVYYVYYTADNTPYFYNNDTQEVTYDRPVSGIIYNPDMSLWDGTKPCENQAEEEEQVNQDVVEATQSEQVEQDEIVVATQPEQVENVEASQPEQVKQDEVVEAAQQKPETDPEKSQPPTNGPRKHRRKAKIVDPQAHVDEKVGDSRMFLPGEGEFVPPLPEDFSFSFTLKKYAQEFFRDQKSGSIFTKKSIPIDKVIKFSSDCISAPLHADVPETLEKTALSIFQNILQYQGVSSNGKPKECALQIVKIIKENPSLTDEAFFQIIKQCNEAPEESYTTKGLELFQLIASLYPASKRARLYIVGFLSALCRSPVQEIADRSSFTYIRFMARTGSETPLNFDDVDAVWPPVQEMVDSLSKEYLEGNHLFDASLYEMIWYQVKINKMSGTYPSIIVDMTQNIIDNGALTKEGVFRVPGSKRKQQEKSKLLQKGILNFDGLDMNDSATFFKAWIRCLTCPIVPFEMINQFVISTTSKQYVEFANKLPLIHKDTLKYLIGFCRKIASASSTNMMVPKNLAICFAPNIVVPPASMSSRGDEINQYTIDFIIYLIDNWDVSDIYDQ